MTLRVRVALFIALALTLALALQGWLGWASFQRFLLADLDRDLNRYAVTTITQITHPGPLDGDHDTQGGLSWDFESGHRAQLMVNGKLRFAVGGAMPAGIDAKGRGPATVGIYRVQVYEVSGALLPTTLVVAAPLRDYLLAQQNYQRALLFTIPLIALAGALAAWIIASHVLRPLHALSAAAGQVATSGDLNARVPPARGGGELTELTTQFNVMLERLSEFRQRETNFTRYASHELRTPLAAMKAQLDALEHGWETSEEALPEVRAQVERMTSLTAALLLLAREGEASRAPADLAELVRSTALKDGAVYFGPLTLTAELDPVLVTRAVENLLENAARYAPGIPASVTLRDDDGRAAIIVEDTGPGVAPQALGRLAEAFYRAPGSLAGGHGLGLAVARRIAQAHGGCLNFAANEPSGLRATLELRRHA